MTAADLAHASHIRDNRGWHRVVRVNESTVSVATDFILDERVSMERVLEYAIDGRPVTPC